MNSYINSQNMTEVNHIRLSARHGEVIKYLFYNDNITLRELTYLLKITFPTASKLIEDLQLADYVAVHNERRSSGGRRAIQYQLNPAAGYIICADAGRLNTKLAIMDLSRNVIAQRHFRSRVFRHEDGFLPLMTKNIEEMKAEIDVPNEKYIGMGIGIPGFVNTDLGTSYSFLNYFDKPIRDVLEDAFGLPVVISNDVNLMAHAECKFGSAKDHSDALVINLGWGIGLGLILNGEVYRGADGFAGEFGHIQVKEGGEQCHCGKYGCLETVASGEAIEKEAIRRLENGGKSLLEFKAGANRNTISARKIVQAAQAGDEFSINLLHESGTAIGKTLAMVLQVLNPKTIILGGKHSQAGKLLTNSIEQSLHRYTHPRIGTDILIQNSTLGETSNILGAASMVIENILSPTMSQKDVPIKTPA